MNHIASEVKQIFIDPWNNKCKNKLTILWLNLTMNWINGDKLEWFHFCAILNKFNFYRKFSILQIVFWYSVYNKLESVPLAKLPWNP